MCTVPICIRSPGRKARIEGSIRESTGSGTVWTSHAYKSMHCIRGSGRNLHEELHPTHVRSGHPAKKRENQQCLAAGTSCLLTLHPCISFPDWYINRRNSLMSYKVLDLFAACHRPGRHSLHLESKHKRISRCLVCRIEGHAG